MIDALRAEVASGPEPADHLVRLGLRINPDAAADLHDRIWAIVNEYADRAPDPDGTDYGLFVVLHQQHRNSRRRVGEPRHLPQGGGSPAT